MGGIVAPAGMGIGLVFWGVAAGTPEAANAAMRYVFFHWGIRGQCTAWSLWRSRSSGIAAARPPLISSVTDSLPRRKRELRRRMREPMRD